MIAETPRLILRPLCRADLADLTDMYGHDPNMLYLPAGHGIAPEAVPDALEKYLAHYDAWGFGMWGIEEKQSGRFIGHCGLQHIDVLPDVEIAYMIHEPWWGQGYATEAAIASVTWGFDTLGLSCICALVHGDNERSVRVIEKLHMTFAGPLKAWGMDLLHYKLDRDAFEELRGCCF